MTWNYLFNPHLIRLYRHITLRISILRELPIFL